MARAQHKLEVAEMQIGLMSPTSFAHHFSVTSAFCIFWWTECFYRGPAALPSGAFCCKNFGRGRTLPKAQTWDSSRGSSFSKRDAWVLPFQRLLAFIILWLLLAVTFSVFLNLSTSKVIARSHNSYKWWWQDHYRRKKLQGCGMSSCLRHQAHQLLCIFGLLIFQEY